MLVAVILVAALTACEEEGPPGELLEVADRSEEIDFSTIDGADAFEPRTTSHRFFKDTSGYNLGVSVAFEDPQREPFLTFHMTTRLKARRRNIRNSGVKALVTGLVQFQGILY